MLTSVGRWTIDHDPEATATCYAKCATGNGCDCTDCKNFAAALDHAFPESFRSLADELGIDVSKFAELCHWCREDSGLHYTGGWFHIVGKIKEGRDAWKQTGEESWSGDLEEWQDNIELGFSNKIALLPDPFEDKAVVQLEFATRVPWVIDEPESP